MSTNITTNTANNNLSAPLTKNEIETFHDIIGIGQQMKSMAVLANAISELTKQIAEMKKENQLRDNRLNDNVTTVINSLIKSQDNVAATIKKQHETDRKQVYAINNRKEPVDKFNPLFFSTLTQADQKSWRKIIEGDIERLHIDSGRGVCNIHRELYSGMRRFGHDVNKLLDEYRKENSDASIMDMCMSSDILRSSLSAQVEIMKQTNTTAAKSAAPVNRNKLGYDFVQANKSPAETRKIIALLSKNGRWSSWASKKTLDALRKKVDVDAIVKDFTKSNNLSKCNPWFAISKNKIAMNELNYMVSGSTRF